MFRHFCESAGKLCESLGREFVRMPVRTLQNCKIQAQMRSFRGLGPRLKGAQEEKLCALGRIFSVTG